MNAAEAKILKALLGTCTAIMGSPNTQDAAAAAKYHALLSNELSGVMLTAADGAPAASPAPAADSHKAVA